MISGWFEAVGRQRRPILLTGLVVAVAEGTSVALGAAEPTPWVVIGAVVVLTILTLLGFLQHRPAALEVRPRGFVTPPRAQSVFLGLLFVLIALDRAGQLAADLAAGEAETFDFVLRPFQIVVAALLFVQGWVGNEAALRPDGLRIANSLGVMLVPWQALPAAYVARRSDGRLVHTFPPAFHPTEPAESRPTEIRFGYGHPELVRTRGIVYKKRLHADTVDAAFLAAAINFYSQHPEEQGSIGTDAGYQRLLQALQ